MKHIASSASVLAILLAAASARGEPVCESPRPATLAPPSRGIISSGFGPRLHPLLNITRLHTGLDFAAPVGDPVFAAAAGKVVFVGRRGNFGNAIVLDHGGGLTTHYTQLSKFEIEDGACVAKRQIIARVGNTGVSTGPHLHFEARENDKPVDPLKFMSGRAEPEGQKRDP